MATGEKGQVLPLVALMMVVVGAVALWLGRLGGAAVTRAQAQTAADAAALAGAAVGRDAAAAAARWNHARLVSYEEQGADARVEVELGGAEAVARARWLPDLAAGGPAQAGQPPGGDPARSSPASSRGGLAPALRAALRRAGDLLGTPVPITSGYRSRAQQAALYARRASNPYPVAPPGTSRHERGLAVDVPSFFVPRLLRVAGQVGLCHPYPRSDPVHFELCTRGLP
ncbi:MAG TPA: M15 family metallopeptidase [bacterium]|nr:M15 family metallopeptidase [bacterium]